MDKKNVFLKAADLLIERGWCQYIREDYNGRLCALGALGLAEQSTWERTEAMDAFGEFLGLDYSGYANPLFCVAPWNNAPERTQAEVIDMLIIASVECR